MEKQTENISSAYDDRIIVILGGLGFIDKNLLEYIIKHCNFKQIINNCRQSNSVNILSR